MSKKVKINVKAMTLEQLTVALKNARGTTRNNIVNEINRRTK